MKTWVRKTLSVGVLAAGALLFAPGAANADVRHNADIQQTTGVNNGFLNGSQIAVPVRVPVNIVGNSLAILGAADATGVGVNDVESAHTTEGRRRVRQTTGVNNGIANGSQVYLPITVPVNVVGNAIGVLGQAQATGVGVNHVESAHTTEGFFPGDSQFTGVNNGFLNGTQIYAPIDVPVNVCGNSIGLLGGASAHAICANDLSSQRRGGPVWRKKESAKVTEGARQTTGLNNGIANGTQLFAPISLPVNLSGNAIAVLGKADARAVSVNESGRNDDIAQTTGVNNGLLNGSQIAVPINVPINACGNALGVLGAAQATAACTNGPVGFFGGGHDDDQWWGDDNGGDGGHGGKGHGGKGHGGKGHGGKGNGDNAGDHGGQYAGDHGNAGNGGHAGNNGHGGYGDTKPAHAGYGDEKPAAADNYGGGDDSDDSTGGGRPAADESSPVSSLTETVSGNDGLGGLGLLNTLR